MRLMLRFLCVVVMLQVSTPFVHGMAEEAGDAVPLLAPTYGERVKKVWPSANLKKLFRYECTKVMCAILAAGAIIGYAVLFVQPLGQKDPAVIPLISKCPVYAWDRSNVSCSPRSKLIEAIAACQTKLMDGDLVPVCNDFSRNFEFPVGSIIGGREWCADYMNLTGGEYPAIVVGDTSRVLKKSYEWEKRGIRACRLRCMGVGSCDAQGLVIPHSFLGEAVDFTAYEERIVGYPEEMEEINYCKRCADQERKAKSCYGPITYNANSTSNAHSTKPKKNDASKRTKRKRRTQ